MSQPEDLTFRPIRALGSCTCTPCHRTTLLGVLPSNPRAGQPYHRSTVAISVQSELKGVPRFLFLLACQEWNWRDNTFLSLLVFLARRQTYNFEIQNQSSTIQSAGAMAHLSSTQRQLSFVGLSLLSLSALTTHVILYQLQNSLPGKRFPASAILPVILSVFGSVAGCFIWILSFSGNPAVEGARNKAILYGLGAANLGIFGLLMLRPGSSGSVYFGCVVWPALAGWTAGSLVWEVANSKGSLGSGSKYLWHMNACISMYNP